MAAAISSMVLAFCSSGARPILGRISSAESSALAYNWVCEQGTRICDRHASRDDGGVKNVEMPRARCDATCPATFEAGVPKRYAEIGVADAIMDDRMNMAL